jgi:leishmanolysin
VLKFVGPAADTSPHMMLLRIVPARLAVAAPAAFLLLGVLAACSENNAAPASAPTATAATGSAARIVAATPQAFSARVGELASPAPVARVLDASGNPIPSTPVTVTLAGGGRAPSSLLTDADGNVSITPWQLSTTAGQNVLTVTAGSASTSFTANLAAGEPSQLIVVSGNKQTVKAGATTSPIVVRVADQFGNGLASNAATFAVTAGNGSLAATSAVASSDGSITMPAWTLGRSAAAQTVHVIAGTFATDVSATIQTDYKIDVRFFGPAMTDAQKALFTNAAARISGVITGDLPDAAITNFDASSACGVKGLPTINETVDDLVIYASIANIDGAGGVLAESGPCVLRNSAQGGLTAVGVMLFDAADVAAMATQGITQDVITHEMLHVVGIGTLWQPKALITAAGTSAVAYLGAGAKQSCLTEGGAGACSTYVPVENNGVIGTADNHWRESTFGNELMTGYVNPGNMPFSAISVGSLSDIGYVVNGLAADPYTLPSSSAAASTTIVPTRGAPAWEAPLSRGVILDAAPGGAPTMIRRP